MGRWLIVVTLILTACAPAAGSSAPSRAGAIVRPEPSPSVFLEDLTWTELRDQISAGKTTVIIPVGGVEQSGPFIALGKHDARVRVLAGRIATALGDALVAPVVAYVPEGDVDPPTGHMRFAGTITVPPEVFRQTLVSAAQGFRLHGFRDIVLIGDHGGYQGDLQTTADQLNRLWAAGPARAHYIGAYYGATQGSYRAALKARGFTAEQIGVHAGLADASLTLALTPQLVRLRRLRDSPPPGPTLGVHGDARRASAALGALGVEEIVRQSVRDIRTETQRR